MARRERFSDTVGAMVTPGNTFVNHVDINIY